MELADDFRRLAILWREAATQATEELESKMVRAAKSRASQADASSETLPRWTFLTNHAHVLTVLESEPKLVLREVALRVGITERAVQRIVMELEESGFIERERVGRQNHYRVIKHKPLRHPLEAHKKIGDLLKLIKS
ncbi:MAG: winged helix-turn-helix transcriptional regulator [Planctomycetales bacterium]|nr:winged helix-turn-helix transcriptional regulator [Planctomycetales bacterium]